MMDEIIVDIIKDIFSHKQKVSQKNINEFIKQYNIDIDLLSEEDRHCIFDKKTK